MHPLAIAADALIRVDGRVGGGSNAFGLLDAAPSGEFIMSTRDWRCGHTDLKKSVSALVGWLVGRSR